MELLVYYAVCLGEYLLLFFLEFFFIDMFSPLFFQGITPLWFYLIFLLLINPIIVFMTSKVILKRLFQYE